MTLPHSQATPTNWKITLLSQPHPLDVSQLLPLNYDAFPHLMPGQQLN